MFRSVAGELLTMRGCATHWNKQRLLPGGNFALKVGACPETAKAGLMMPPTQPAHANKMIE